jgi:hypothetical protein
MFEVEKFYWTIVVALVSALWVAALFIRDRHSSSAERSSALVNRLLESDKLIMEHPDIQKYLSLSVTKSEEYFVSPEVLQDAAFYKAKAFAYWHINLFDEILSLAAHSRTIPPLLAPPDVIELSDWEEYIKRKCRHPLYRSILNNESEIFGAALRDFWSTRKDSISSASASPFMW